MIVRLDLSNDAIAAALYAMQGRAYRVEAEIMGFEGTPPLNESLNELRRSREGFYGFFTGSGELAGAIAIEREGERVTISRLMVDPPHFRKGIGRALLRFVLEQEAGARRILVSTGSLNTPALELYRQHGFREKRQREVAPGILVTHLERPAAGQVD